MIENIPLILSALSFIGMTVLGVLGWRSGRFKPQVDMSQIAQSAQEIAEKALEGQSELTAELEQVKNKLNGQYEIKAIVRFYPKPEILEVSMRRLPGERRKSVREPG